MMAARSSRTMIKCTPGCGPGPVLSVVSGLPSGSRTVKETVTGRPGTTVPDGSKPPSVKTRAGAITGAETAPPELEPQPARAKIASRVSTAAATRAALISTPPSSQWLSSQRCLQRLGELVDSERAFQPGDDHSAAVDREQPWLGLQMEGLQLRAQALAGLVVHVDLLVDERHPLAELVLELHRNVGNRPADPGNAQLRG